MDTKNIYEKMRSLAQSRAMLYGIYGLIVVLVLVFVFQAGISLGYRKALFDRNMNSHYQENFGPRGFGGPGSPNPNGAFGTIISKQGTSLSIEEPNNTEKVILVDAGTIIRQNRNQASLDDLLPNMRIVVVGEPNDQGQVIAKFIRIIQ